MEGWVYFRGHVGLFLWTCGILTMEYTFGHAQLERTVCTISCGRNAHFMSDYSKTVA